MRRNNRQAALLLLTQRFVEDGRKDTRQSDQDLLGRITARDVENARCRMESQYQEWKSLGSPSPSGAVLTRAHDRRQAAWETWNHEYRISRRLARSHVLARCFRYLDRDLVQFLHRLAKWNDAGVVAALLMMGTLGAGLGAVAAVAFASSPVGGLAMVLIAFLLGVTFPLGALLVVPEATAEKLREVEARRREQDFRTEWAQVQYKAAEKECSRLEEGSVARDRYESAKQQYEAYCRIHQSKKNELLLRDWRSLRGTLFEQFLAEVFEDLGYSGVPHEKWTRS